jgi:hypothetical protein
MAGPPVARRIRFELDSVAGELEQMPKVIPLQQGRVRPSRLTVPGLIGNYFRHSLYDLQ